MESLLFVGLALLGALALLVFLLKQWRLLLKLALVAALVLGVVALLSENPDLAERLGLRRPPAQPADPSPAPPGSGGGSLPDFAVRLVVLDPPGALPSDSSASLYVTVVNYGAPYAGPVEVMRREYVPGGAQGFNQVDGLDWGQQKVVPVPAAAGVRGSFAALVLVDPYNKIPERDESNNAYPPVPVQFY